MTAALQPIITNVGLQAALNASNDGLQAKLTHIALGDSGWQPNANATQLQQGRQRISISSSSRLQSNQLHITAVENGDQNYWVCEIGLFLEDGTLLAIWSDAEQALAWKSADVDLLLAFDLLLTALPADSVIIDGSGGLELSPATDQQRGIVRLATIEEAKQGTDALTAITPAGCQIHGDSRYALTEHDHSWSAIKNKPSTYPAASHHHDNNYAPIKHHHDKDYAALKHNHDSDYAKKDGSYSELRARATTKSDVGLGNVPNYSATSSVTDDSTSKLATAKAVKKAYDQAQARQLVWGSSQMTGYLNDLYAVLDYKLPTDCVMVGLSSTPTSSIMTDRRWRIRYRKLTLK
jgi:phage-related tail fiber protein